MEVFLIEKKISKISHVQSLLSSKDMRKALKISLCLLILVFVCLYLSIVFLRGYAPSYALEKNVLFLLVYICTFLLFLMVKLLWDFSFFNKSVQIQEGKIIDWKGKVILEDEVKSILFVGDSSMDIFYKTKDDLLIQRIRFEYHQPEFLRDVARTINAKKKIPFFKKNMFLDHFSTPINNF